VIVFCGYSPQIQVTNKVVYAVIYIAPPENHGTFVFWGTNYYPMIHPNYLVK